MNHDNYGSNFLRLLDFTRSSFNVPRKLVEFSARGSSGSRSYEQDRTDGVLTIYGMLHSKMSQLSILRFDVRPPAMRDIVLEDLQEALTQHKFSVTKLTCQ